MVSVKILPNKLESVLIDYHHNSYLKFLFSLTTIARWNHLIPSRTQIVKRLSADGSLGSPMRE